MKPRSYEEHLDWFKKIMLKCKSKDFLNSKEDYMWLLSTIRTFRKKSDAIGDFKSRPLLESRLLSNIPSANLKDFHVKVYSISEAADFLNVSTKTISRWRAQGLPSFRSKHDSGSRSHFVCILESDLQEFKIRHSAKAEKGSKFSQLLPSEKASILIDAKSRVSHGQCPADVTKSVAQESGRSVETVRYIIKEHDLMNPESKLFYKITDDLSSQEKDHVFEIWRDEGKSEEELSKLFCRSKTMIRDVLIEKRLNNLALSISPLREASNDDSHSSFCLLPEDFVWSEDFETLPESEILTASGDQVYTADNTSSSTDLSTSLDFYMKSLYSVRTMSNTQMQFHFRKMNFLKWKIHNSLKDICSNDFIKVTNKEMGYLESLSEDASNVKNLLVSANLRLVVSIARRHVESESLFSLVSDGNISLMRAVDKFDFTLGTKFSTYATAAISKNYSRTVPKELKTREKFKPTCDEVFQLQEDTRANMVDINSSVEHVNSTVHKLTNVLDSRELEIISLRFGLDYSKEPMTLKEVGAEVGLTKERVRQIADTALVKMRRIGVALGYDDF
jgi:RNA polymerase primary sigma factor